MNNSLSVTQIGSLLFNWGIQFKKDKVKGGGVTRILYQCLWGFFPQEKSQNKLGRCSVLERGFFIKRVIKGQNTHTNKNTMLPKKKSGRRGGRQFWGRLKLPLSKKRERERAQQWQQQNDRCFIEKRSKWIQRYDVQVQVHVHTEVSRNSRYKVKCSLVQLDLRYIRLRGLPEEEGEDIRGKQQN